MVEDRITDPTRVAQLLASELTGLSVGPLADVEVVDADRSAAPSPEGTVAYGVAHAEDRVARVVLYPGRVAVAFADASDGTVLTVESASEVKGAVDAIRERLAARG
jgi:hypothetical protein